MTPESQEVQEARAARAFPDLSCGRTSPMTDSPPGPALSSLRSKCGVHSNRKETS